MHNPGRLWRRYLTDILVCGPRIAYQVWVVRRSRSSEGPRLFTRRLANWEVVSVQGPLVKDSLGQVRRTVDDPLSQGVNVVLDLRAATMVDSVAVGYLVTLRKRAADARREIRVVGPSGRVRKALRACSANDLYPTYAALEDALRSDPTIDP